MTPAARIAASIELLAGIEAADLRPADAVANDYFRERRFIGSSDRRAISDGVWTILRQRRRLGWLLGSAAESPRLLVSASLLVQGWSIKDLEQTFTGGRFCPAALSAVELAVLRPLQGKAPVDPAMPEAVRHEIPDWLLPLFSRTFGDGLRAEMDALQQQAPLDLRVNLLKTDRPEALQALRGEGFAARATDISPWGIRIDGRRPVTSGPAFQSGLVEIQDEGSQLVAAMVGAEPGMRVADWCAGAGGKTLALASVMQNRGQIVACDVSATRLDGAVRRLRRAGVHNVERHLIQAGDKWAKRRVERFDRVLVDAPCTGTGTWRRNPDARHRLTQTDLTELSVKQTLILDTVQSLVRKGGRLVYATCSFLEEENEAQVSGFLNRHPHYAVVPLAQAWPFSSKVPASGDFLSLTPARHGTDGFFAAVLERTA